MSERTLPFARRSPGPRSGFDLSDLQQASEFDSPYLAVGDDEEVATSARWDKET
jgi:hypothetical protein